MKHSPTDPKNGTCIFTGEAGSIQLLPGTRYVISACSAWIEATAIVISQDVPGGDPIEYSESDSTLENQTFEIVTSQTGIVHVDLTGAVSNGEVCTFGFAKIQS